MTALIGFFAARRKAIGYTLAALAQLITEAIPQTNSQNALLLHGILAVLGFVMVYTPANDSTKPDSVEAYLDQLVRGDEPKPAAPAAVADTATLPALPPVPLG